MTDQKHASKLKSPPRPINWESGVFECGGNYYYVVVNGMSVPRLIRMIELAPSVLYGRTMLDMADFIHELRDEMTTGDESMKETWFSVCNKLTAFDQLLLDNATDYAENHVKDVLRFCALFCVSKDEDISKLDDRIIEDKVKLWYESDLDIMAFFLFAISRLGRYKQILSDLMKEINGGKSPLKLT